jgi:glyoxylase-like metal-dependent hydrolase (beta-lactamase superfamily II)
MPESNDLVFHQILAGPMANFVYLIGSRRTGECLLVDPAWDIDELLRVAAADDLKPVGALVTHYHPDHIGGDIFGLRIAGLPALLERISIPAHVNTHEGDGVRKVTGLAETDLVRHESGDVLTVGDVRIRLIHTPGHTPGSQCFLVNDERLVSGDTLFIGACGRVDLPGADPDQMYESLTQKLAKLPPDTVLYPGHDYASTPTSSIGHELKTNRYLNVRSLDDWRMMMGVGGLGG